MRLTLRKLVLASAAIATAVLTTGTAMAQTRITVPFSFNVAGRHCPAGVYSVGQGSVGIAVSLMNVQTSQRFSWAIGPGDPAPDDSRIILTFDRFGDHFNLKTVQYRGMITPKLDSKAKRLEYAKNSVASPTEVRITAGQ